MDKAFTIANRMDGVLVTDMYCAIVVASMRRTHTIKEDSSSESIDSFVTKKIRIILSSVFSSSHPFKRMTPSDKHVTPAATTYRNFIVVANHHRQLLFIYEQHFSVFSPRRFSTTTTTTTTTTTEEKRQWQDIDGNRIKKRIYFLRKICFLPLLCLLCLTDPPVPFCVWESHCSPYRQFLHPVHSYYIVYNNNNNNEHQEQFGFVASFPSP
jgi:hypothetical protein